MTLSRGFDIFGVRIQWSVSFSSDAADRGRGWRVAAGWREPECGECYRRRVESRAHRDAPDDATRRCRRRRRRHDSRTRSYNYK